MCGFPWLRWVQSMLVVGLLLVLVALSVPWVQDARDTARKTRSRDNLRQLGITLYQYHDAYRAFPPGAVVGEDGTAFHGCFTQILPYIDSNPFYNPIDQHRPWDHPANVDHFRVSIRCYLIPDVDETVTSDGFGLIHYQANPNVFHRNSHTSADDLKDGAEHTWLAGETAGRYQPWGYPFNWRPLGLKLNSGPESFGRPTGDGAFLLMADGAVQFFDNDVSEGVLKALRDAQPVAAPERTVVPDRRFEY